MLATFQDHVTHTQLESTQPSHVHQVQQSVPLRGTHLLVVSESYNLSYGTPAGR